MKKIWKPGPPPQEAGKQFIIRVDGSECCINDFFVIIHRAREFDTDQTYFWADEWGKQVDYPDEWILFHSELNLPERK